MIINMDLIEEMQNMTTQAKKLADAGQYNKAIEVVDQVNQLYKDNFIEDAPVDMDQQLMKSTWDAFSETFQIPKSLVSNF